MTTAVPPSAAPPRESRLLKFEWFVSLLLLATCIALRWHTAWHLHGLWRDEVNSVNIVRLPTLVDLYNNLEYDSFPLLWLLILRTFQSLGGTSDASLRMLGFVMSLVLPLGSWWTCRQFGVRPLLVFLFAGVSPLFVIWAGVQNRAYGLAAGLAMLLLGAMWRAYVRRDWRSYLIFIGVALAACHTSYHNAVLLLAATASLAAVMIARRRWNSLIAFIAIGVGIGLSMTIYLPSLIRARRWVNVVQDAREPVRLYQGVVRAAADGAPGMATALGIAVAIAIAVVIYRLRLRRVRVEAAALPSQQDALAFAALLVVLVAALQSAFLLALGYLTPPWYYATPILVAAVGLDLILGQTPLRTTVRKGKLGLAVLLAILWLPFEWAATSIQLTNVDLIAAQLNVSAEPEDLVVVFPFPIGISLSRYYRGPAAVVTLPDLHFTRWHRFDLLKDKFGDPRAAFPVLDRMSRALNEHHHVWMVGALPWDQADGYLAPPPLPRPGDPSADWQYTRWDTAWAVQAAYLLKSRRASLIDYTPKLQRDAQARVNPTENEPLVDFFIR